MRISEWSSDVCSSDLGERDRILIAGQLVAAVGRQRIARILRGQADDLAVLLGPQIGQLVAREEVDKGKAVVLAAKRDRRLDRKSVVSGKSVSVRVDLGGRRIITKTTTAR